MSSHLAALDPDWRSKCQPQRHKTLEERFHEKTERDTLTGCLLWLGAHDKDGYGFIRINGKNIKAHRVSLEWKLGRPLSASEQAMHRCDRPECVEPSHLLVGSNSDNQIDSIIKRRKWSQRLTFVDVRAIRQRHASGESQASIGRAFNVHNSQINKIIKRVKWRHVA